MGLKQPPAWSTEPLPYSHSTKPKAVGESWLWETSLNPSFVRKSSELVRRSLGLVPCLAVLPLWAQGQHRADFLGWRVSWEPAFPILPGPLAMDTVPGAPCALLAPCPQGDTAWGHCRQQQSGIKPGTVHVWYNFFPASADLKSPCAIHVKIKPRADIKSAAAQSCVLFVFLQRASPRL